MKRREFLIASAGFASVPVIAQVKPCPSPSMNITGGTTATTTCGVGAEADWIARSTANGVVWAHDFRSDAEVDAFRWVSGFGNDPNSSRSNDCTRVASDGFGNGGCLEIRAPTGGHADASWWRPFSALPAPGNGLPTNDRGYVSGPAWNASNPSQNGQWTRGYYGHADYHDGATWDGSDFYIQFRVKIQGTRYSSGNPDGKLAFIGTTGLTPVQELLLTSRRNPVFYIYTGFGSPGPYEFLGDPQGNPTRWQPGGVFHSTCTGAGPNSTNASRCWAFRGDEWVTVLIHVICGHGSTSSYNGGTDNGIQVWVAREGETSYTQIYNKLDYAIQFSGNKPRGWNAFQPSCYMNGANAATGWFQRYTQIIFSKQFIACPQV